MFVCAGAGAGWRYVRVCVCVCADTVLVLVGELVSLSGSWLMVGSGPYVRGYCMARASRKVEPIVATTPVRMAERRICTFAMKKLCETRDTHTRGEC